MVPFLILLGILFDRFPQFLFYILFLVVIKPFFVVSSSFVHFGKRFIVPLLSPLFLFFPPLREILADLFCHFTAHGHKLFRHVFHCFLHLLWACRRRLTLSRACSWILNFISCKVVFSSLLLITEDLVSFIYFLEFVLVESTTIIRMVFVAFFMVHVFYVLL